MSDKFTVKTSVGSLSTSVEVKDFVPIVSLDVNQLDSSNDYAFNYEGFSIRENIDSKITTLSEFISSSKREQTLQGIVIESGEHIVRFTVEQANTLAEDDDGVITFKAEGVNVLTKNEIEVEYGQAIALKISGDDIKEGAFIEFYAKDDSGIFDSQGKKNIFCGKIMVYSLEIKAKKPSYTVVLDKAGQVFTGYDSLELEVTGPPNYFIDIQMEKKTDTAFTNKFGITNSWDKTKLPKDRVGIKTFSSWTNGDTALKLDASGKATYTVPLEWWRDLARQKLVDFTTMKVNLKVLAAKQVADTPIESAISEVEIHNNLVSFALNNFGYIAGGKKSISMVFTVKEVNTTEMYTFVQWMQGTSKQWPTGSKVFRHPRHKLYNIIHDYNFPDKTIDRLRTNPRYWDGNYTISNGGKTATATDKPGGDLPTGYSHKFITLDFETRLHFNYDVPASVSIIRQDGSPPVYGVITGELSGTQPLIITNAFWELRILKIRNTDGTTTVTHPATFAGP